VFNRTAEAVKVDAKLITIVQEPSWSPIHINNPFLTASDVLVIHDAETFEKQLGIKILNPKPYRRPTDKPQVIETPSYMWYHDHVDKSFFDGIETVKKKKKISMIVSNIYMSVGNYVKRIELVEKILKSDLDIDIYGRGLNIDDPRYKGEIENKFTGLIPYEYSIAIENSCEKNYVTEKFIDPILCSTIPIYYGAPNIGEIYNDWAFDKIDLDSPTIIDDIKVIIEIGAHNISGLNDAKNSYFHEYNLYSLLKTIG